MSEIISKDIAVPELTKKQQYQRQWYLDNQEHIIEQRNLYKEKRKPRDHLYYINNIDKIKEWQGTKVACQCGGRYTLPHKALHEKTNLHIKSLEIA